ncbi:MAG: amidohydrolase [Bacteroidetes bacterium]|nr:amidohydrolase [Bacteroidota bacterium]
MQKIFWSLVSLLIFTSCNSKRKVDLILFNGTIYTVNESFTIAEAVAVRGGMIKAIGTTDDILSDYDAVNKIDLKGKPLYPGFIDAHCHFYGYGIDMLKCNLYGTTSFEEVLHKVSEFAATNKFEWLLGRGWDQNDWEVKEYPTKEKLDSLFPHIPVYLMRIDGHAVLCNTEALNRAKISTATKVNGGEILQKDGKLTGILIDNAVDIVKNVIPEFSEAQRAQALLDAQKNCFAVGLTTVDDAGLGKDTIQLIDKLQKEGTLKMRVYAMIADDERTLKYFFHHGPYKTDRLNVRSVKMYADGALGSRGACLLKPYTDQPGHYGFLLHDIAFFDKICEEAHDNGFQVCTHAIGDSAVRTMLKIYGEHLGTENDRRWRIEHCQVVDVKDINNFSKYSIIPSVQPTHATSDMYWAADRLGTDRIKTAYAYNDLMDNSANKIAFGTDFPVEDINPLYTFYAATERQDLKSFPKNGFQPDNRIKKKDALRAMTIWAARSNFEEEEKGSIEEGKFADFVLLDQDIIKIEGSKIPKVKVLATFLNGEKVYGE